MANNMLRFTELAKQMPAKRGVGERRQDFREIYDDFDEEKAADQASRCSQCGIPFCQVHCPVQNNIPDWLMLTAEGRLEEAYEVSQATNNFPEICGRICPQDRLCEGSCVIEQSGHGTVTIGSVERYITDTAWEKGWVKPVTPAVERQESVGIVGAGPAGMAAAEELRRQGYKVTIYDRYDRAGGLMIYGIPGFKLEKPVVERRVTLLQDAGITFELNCEVGRDVSLNELRNRHASVLLATGVYKPRALKVPGVGMPGVVKALDFLIASNRRDLGDAVPAIEDGSLWAEGKRVIVVGGGDTAMDCVRTAVRQGATSVRCLYRRDRVNMPGSQREVANAEEEGVQFLWLSAPEAVLGDNKAERLRAAKVHLGLPDATGRQTPQIQQGTSEDFEADLVIEALGFDPEPLPALFGEPALKVSRWGSVIIDHATKMSSLPGVFAAGDIVRGASLVVWGIRDGRDAAASIHSYIQAQVPAQAAE
ncbi:MAG: NAD(P)-dependent oxidoreductase [Pseudomonadota bacterium]